MYLYLRNTTVIAIYLKTVDIIANSNRFVKHIVFIIISYKIG
jgi:hypothetical protein